MPPRVIIYGKTNCPYTRKARAAYREHEYFDVIQDEQKKEEMLILSRGVRKIPVIVDGDTITIGYDGGA